MFETAAIQRQGLPEQVAEQLEQLIVEGGLAVGERLPPERQLAERLGCSRSVVREAAKQLAMRGLVSIEQGRGSFVCRPQAAGAAASVARLLQLGDIADLDAKVLDMRSALEPAIARRAAERATAEELTQVEGCLERMRSAANDAPSFVQADVDFHIALARAAGNELFRLVIEPMVDLVREHIEGRISSRQSGVRRSLAEHQAILAAVRAGDGEAAFQAMAGHLERC